MFIERTEKANKQELALSKIKLLKKEKRLSVAVAARYLGFTRSSWYALERGEIPLTLDRLSKIAELANVDISYFLETQKAE